MRSCREKIWARSTGRSRSLEREFRAEGQSPVLLGGVGKAWVGSAAAAGFYPPFPLLSSLLQVSPKPFPDEKLSLMTKSFIWGAVSAQPFPLPCPDLRNPARIQPLHFQLSPVSWSSLGKFFGKELLLWEAPASASERGRDPN